MKQATINTQDLWKSALAEIKTELSEANFNTWFKDAYIADIDDGVAQLAVPNQFVKDWIENKYHHFLLKTLRKLVDEVRSIEYIIEQRKEDVGNEREQTKNFEALPLEEVYINKENNLNPRYSFNSFIVGSFNELAYAAAQQILKNLGVSYNPFFVYGRTGYGKTHLIQAIGNTVQKNSPEKKVYYVTTERFSQDLVNALQSNKIVSFKKRYRQYDVLIVDDIQFLSKKEKTQEELFHLFNELYEHNKQIVFSSDQHPNFIPDLEERLKSRFNAGMIIDIGAPDKESRIAILKSKAAQFNFSLEDDVAEYIASVVEGNVRDLEGALNSVMLQSQLKEKDLSVKDVRIFLKNSVRPKKQVSIKEVVKRVAGFYHIDEENIYKKTRKKEVVKPRQLIMYILREDYNIPYPAIGDKLGGRDHTTVIHSYEKIKGCLEEDANLEREVNQLRGLL